jgi:hypothetical protein
LTHRIRSGIRDQSGRLKFAAVIFGDDVAGFVAGLNPPYYGHTAG